MDKKKIIEHIRSFFENHYEGYCLCFKHAHTSYRSFCKPFQDDRIPLIEDIVDNLEGNIGDLYAESGNSPLFSKYIQSLYSFTNMVSPYIPFLEGCSKELQFKYYVDDLIEICQDMLYLIQDVEELMQEETTRPYDVLRNDLLQENIEQFIIDLNSILANIPYQLEKNLKNEAFFHVSFLSILKVQGFEITAETSIKEGRIDALVRVGNLLYIFEFKYKKNDADTSEVGLKQIKENNYIKPYIIERKKIIGVGVSFDGQTNNAYPPVYEVLYTPS